MDRIEQIYNTDATKKFFCKVSAEQLKEKLENELRKLAPKIKMKGFREGKVPIDYIRQHYGKEAYNTASKEIIQKMIQDIIEQNNYTLVAEPHVEFKQEEVDLAFEVTFDLLPSIPPAFPFETIEVETWEVEVSPEDIANELERIAKSNKSLATKEGEAEVGDTVVIDTVGRIGGIAFEGGKMENYMLELGSGQFIPGFEEQLIGARANKDVIVTVTFPENYHAKDLSGKEAQFFTKVREVKKSEKENIDDNMAKRLAFENLESLKGEIEKKMKNYYANAYKETLKPTVFNQIAKSLTFEVPERMSLKVAETLLKEKNMEPDKVNDVLDEAKEKLRLSFFLNNFAKETELSLTQEDFTNFIIQTAQDNSIDPMVIINYYSKNKEEEKRIRILLEENKMFDYIFNKIKVNKKVVPKVKFDEELNQKKA